MGVGVAVVGDGVGSVVGQAMLLELANLLCLVSDLLQMLGLAPLSVMVL